MNVLTEQEFKDRLGIGRNLNTAENLRNLAPKPMSNLDYIHRADIADLASFIEPKLTCSREGCFLYEKCRADIHHCGYCRRIIRRWLEEEYKG